MHRLLSLSCFLLVLTFVAGCNQATRIAQNLVTVNATWNQNATEHRDNNGMRYVYVCPPNPSQTGIGSVWGTDIYSDDSSVCAAGVHTGAITFSGGSVTIEIRDGLDNYSGSTRNGITTLDWTSPWAGSFVVL